MSTTSDSTDIAPASLEAWERCKRSVGNGVSSGLRASQKPHPIFIDRAAGPLLWDLDGRDYVDYVGAWGPMVLGHSHPKVVEAVATVLTKMQLVGMGHRLEYEAAEAVLAAVPAAEKLLWSNSGTECVQVALRLARAWTGRNRFVKFVGGYHGWHDSVFASVAVHADGDRGTPQSKGQNPRLMEDMVVLRFNDVDSVERTLADAAAHDIAAVLVDPILSSGGLALPDPDFLRALREGCDANGVVLIFDEVVSGFRVARGGAAERWGVRPDLWTVGKAVAGGMSQSAVLGREDLIDQVTTGVAHYGTYNGNPLALAGVKATMEVLAEPGIYDHMERVSDRLLSGIGAAIDATGVQLEAHRVSSILSVHAHPTDRGLDDRLATELARRGVLITPGGKLFVSAAHDDATVDRTVDAFQGALRACI
jgi:glutamate-1-semialdehyde 2,1-aminomutase